LRVRKREFQPLAFCPACAVRVYFSISASASSRHHFCSAVGGPTPGNLMPCPFAASTLTGKSFVGDGAHHRAHESSIHAAAAK
jgi:hypothetical protein